MALGSTLSSDGTMDESSHHRRPQGWMHRVNGAGIRAYQGLLVPPSP